MVRRAREQGWEEAVKGRRGQGSKTRKRQREDSEDDQQAPHAITMSVK